MKSVTVQLFIGVLICILCPMFNLNAGQVNFDQYKINQPPEGWHCGKTGMGSPKWLVIGEATAPSKPNVLSQSGWGSFPWCVLPEVSLKNGSVQVKFKPLSGMIDQAGGLIWRFKNGDEYYVARANALENNVSLYYVKNGRRRTIKYAEAPVSRNIWSTLKVEFSGNRIKVFLNGKKYIDLKDNHISGSGAVGVWTKADSKTLFDDFIYE